MYFKLANYSIVVYHCENILLNFQWKISKTKPWQLISGDVWNQKIKLFLLFYKFPQVTLLSFFVFYWFFKFW